MKREFIKYIFVGGSGVLVDLGTLILIKEWFGVVPYVAVIINQALLIAYSYGLHRFWTFKSKRLAHTEMIRYTIVYIFNYIVAAATMYLFNEILGYEYRLVRLCTIAASVSWNFLLYKYWVFGNLQIGQTSQTAKQ